jgi:NNP family nitrate/nitrite transporter-like MFS transporter
MLLMSALKNRKANKILCLNTFAFTVCFAVWLINGVLVTFLVDNQVFDWSSSQVGWLIGIPVLTGALFRLPAGILTDKFGGRPIYFGLLLLCAIPMYLLSYANGFWSFALCGLGYGLAGASFAIGIAYTSIWFPKKKQGLVLGIFGAGNAGAAITALVGPKLLNYLTDDKLNLDGWRMFPKIYAAALVVVAIIFFFLTENKKPKTATKTLVGILKPLKRLRVWRFGLYYFLVFGCFVSFAGWLIPYYTNVYKLDLATAGILVAAFSFPTGIIRIFGGWISDKYGARKVMYWVLGASIAFSVFLLIPKMDIYTEGKGINAKQAGVVSEVSDQYIKIGTVKYDLLVKDANLDNVTNEFHFLPLKETWQEARVSAGDRVRKKQLIADGKTHIYFQANLWVFALLTILIGAIWGIGMAAVYKHIPDYFPEEVGVVGGMVGVLGGLGGFVCPILFGYLLEGTGMWSSSWMIMFLLSLCCLIWMHRIIKQIVHKNAELKLKQID